MAESTLSITLADMRSAIQFKAGLHPTYGSLSSAEATAVDDCVDQALRWVLLPDAVEGVPSHDWRFLTPEATFATVAPYETGTIEVASGVVTLTSGTFPSWAASGEVIVGGIAYSVASRDGDTQVTLDDTTVTAAAGSTYSLVQWAYPLPDNFAAMWGNIVYQAGSARSYRCLQRVSERQLTEQRQWVDYKTWPTYFAVRPITFTPANGQRYELILWPIANAVYNFNYRYFVNLDTLATTTHFAPGGLMLAQTVIQACRAAAEHRFDDRLGQEFELFRANLLAAINRDQRYSAPDSLGYNGDRSDDASGADETETLPYAAYQQITYDGTVL